jgi:hypothetical protein
VPLLLGLGSDHGGEAYSLAMSGERSLYALGPDGLLHLVSVDPGPDAQRHPVGVARSLQLWMPPGDLVLSAQAFLEPTTMKVEVDGVEVATVPLLPDGWTEHVVEIPDDGRSHLLRLEADTCLATPGSRERNVDRCLSFHVRGLPSPRHELYRSDVDRREARDLSLELEAQRESLDQRLSSYRFEPLASAGAEPLEPEVEEQLKALGYLQ